MSGSETGVLTSGNSQPVIHNLHLAYTADGTAAYKHVPGGSPPYQAGNGGVNLSGEPLKKKRGRPRKYGPDGSMAVPPLSAAPPAPAPAINLTQPAGNFSPPPPQPQPPPLQQPPPQLQPTQSAPQVAGGAPASPPANVSVKKTRGRPPGSSRKQQMEVLGSPGIGFTPHVITVKSGEDVASKIMSFSQNGPRAICILSANGAISSVTLRQAATSGGSVTYEGRFEILSLSGSFMLSDCGGQRSRTGGLSVSLAGPDGRVLGGGVAGLLTAASPVQVVVGSFFPDYRREMNVANQSEPSSTPSKHHHAGYGPIGTSSPPSRGTLSESSGGGPGSPLNHNTGGGAVNSTPQPQGMTSLPWK